MFWGLAAAATRPACVRRPPGNNTARASAGCLWSTVAGPQAPAEVVGCRRASLGTRTRGDHRSLVTGCLRLCSAAGSQSHHTGRPVAGGECVPAARGGCAPGQRAPRAGARARGPRLRMRCLAQQAGHWPAGGAQAPPCRLHAGSRVSGWSSNCIAPPAAHSSRGRSPARRRRSWLDRPTARCHPDSPPVAAAATAAPAPPTTTTTTPLPPRPSCPRVAAPEHVHYHGA